MNKLLLVLLLPFCALSQHEFKTLDSRIVWQHTFTDTVQPLQLFDVLKLRPAYIDCNYDQNIIFGHSDFIDLIKDNSRLAIYARYDVRYSYSIDFKEDKYRVTLTNLFFDPLDARRSLTLDDLLLKSKDGSLRSAKIHQRFYERLHEALIKEFTYTAPEKW
jgi:hypothetical protein